MSEPDLVRRAPRPRPRITRGIDAVLSVQRPVVLAHIRSIRSHRPDASPAQVQAMLERRYLLAVTSGGALVGASAAIPAVGIGASLVLSGVETAGFLEATALFAQSVTELHGIPDVDQDRARTLVMALMLGNGGQELLAQLAGQAAGGGTRGAYWGEFLTRQLPQAAFRPIADKVRDMFLHRFALTQSGSVLGRAIPFGVGAVVGGGGNHLMGRKVVNSARTAFGPAPEAFPATLDPRVKVPKPPRASRARQLPTVIRGLPMVQGPRALVRRVRGRPADAAEGSGTRLPDPGRAPELPEVGRRP